MNDQELLNTFELGGDSLEKAFHYLFHSDKLRNGIRSTLLNMGASEQELPDIIQESLISFYRNVVAKKFKGESSITTYIIGISKFKWLNEMKKARLINGDKADDTYQLADEHTPESLLFQKEGLQLDETYKSQLRNCIRKLDKGCQIALGMWSEGSTMKAIQLKLGYGTAQTAATKALRCRKRLRKLIQNDPHLMHYINSRTT